MKRSKGKVYLVGAGPGDPDLITVRGKELLEKADCVVYDRLVNRELLKYVPSRAERIYCGKWSGFHLMKQEEIQTALVDRAKRGYNVVRLKGGDPSIFGRGGEEAELCADEGIDFEFVPGISSGVAAPAYAGIPLTHRDYASSVAFVTGHSCRKQDNQAPLVRWDELAAGVDTLVIYMGVKNLPEIQKQLLKNGRSGSTPMAFIQQGTTAQQQTFTTTLEYAVEKAVEVELVSPAIIIIGEVVKLREKLSWFEEEADKSPVPFIEVV
ncbi:uroporphyrinogen-III C-methyltransferase [Alkalicoccus halolimnae]|uniref:Uroporphyrinogen-III C-methyltransferase n=1 Tax=Alkalicoccus halolimnae TaxID=1667239 RepID=A0A5C7F2T7_9BACI|nr:uroporphyrinogen-III C-methyltransferase [Alkalicoccus halolimnae]TXF84623.1 uroporphyrinogen-III C-methyltransferase [Alkalicoccus halolimnae]